MKIKLKIKDSIKKEMSWAKDKAGRIIDVNEEDCLQIGPRQELGVNVGAYIPFKHLEIIEVTNVIHEEHCHSCHHCCCKYNG